jgi:hypothetical protein
MKNIHVLPTDKPSRLFKDDFGKLIYSINIDQEQNHFEPQNIYITNDEEIKEGDWCYNSINNNVYKKEINKLSFAYEYKIILTTDQSLDGIQKIDDEFLEWFVKNPSCKFVEVKFETLWLNKRFGGSWQPFPDETATVKKKNYKIIIPKEEQKQHIIDIMRGDEELGLYEEPKQTDEKGGPITFREGLEVSKYVMGIDPYDKQEIVKDLAYWKANAEEDYMKVPISVLRYISELEKQKYSEEDMKQFAWECVANFLSNNVNEVEMALVEVIIDRNNKKFEQFKKK